MTARARTWAGHGFGAEISITLTGPHAETEAALRACQALLRDLERCFSLYDPASELSRLNREGALTPPSPDLLNVTRAADRIHRLTRGAFDPTVQSLWRAAAEGSGAQPMPGMGWDALDWSEARIALQTGQQLTFNGIAQGYATDRVTGALAARGFDDVLVNIGEYRAGSAPYQIGLADPAAGLLGKRTLRNAALATSSPGAMQVGARDHIMHVTRLPRWSSVTVEASTATLADGLSTALVLCDMPEIRQVLQALPEVAHVYLVDRAGDLTRL
jgi:thiamine biosynthesis lipoprotein